MVKFNEEKQERKIADLRKKEAETFTEVMSKRRGLPYADLTIGNINMEALRIISEAEVRDAQIAVFNILNKKVSVGVLSPSNPKTLEVIEKLKKKEYEPIIFLVSEESLESVWSRYKDISKATQTAEGSMDISSQEISDLLNTASSLKNIIALIEEKAPTKTTSRISKILEVILAGALSIDASDVHLEPEENDVRLRYRLDGVLTDIIHFDQKTYSLILSRIKLLSGLKLNIGDAQDGRFSIKAAKEEIEIRTSIIPSAYNETVVMRILNPKAISVPLEKLGINPRLLEILLRETGKPNGMLLTTGPTGSGKTTTLYAFLKKIYSPSTKIITIENPIEYHLQGIVQTQTDAKKNYTFLEGLRSALRQDPDVIMVGEIRDNETAEVAINAALTGHLVFSTLHTNNAAGAFTRLIDLGVNPKILTSAVSIAMAQRLVRKICQNCKKEIALAGTDKKTVEEILKTILDKKYLENIQTEKIWQAIGCEKCNNTGYKGRTGVYEAILANEKIEEIIQQNPSEREIKKAATDQNILDMKQDGILKVLNGITTLEELERAVDITE